MPPHYVDINQNTVEILEEEYLTCPYFGTVPTVTGVVETGGVRLVVVVVVASFKVGYKSSSWRRR